MRWVHVPLFVAIVGMVLFVRLHLGTGRAWLASTVIGLRSVVLVGNFLLPQANFTWREIHSLNHVPFLGEAVATVAQATLGAGQWLATASVVPGRAAVDMNRSLGRVAGRPALGRH